MHATKVIFLFLFLVAQIHSFNIDTNNPIVYVDPAKNSSYSTYFGYTIVLYPGNNKRRDKWIKIGAPRGQDPNIKNFKNPGVIYNCPVLKECKTEDIYTGNTQGNENLTNAWIGGAMDISYKFDRLSICAFRRVEKHRDDYCSVGGCYSSDLNGSFKKIVPLDGKWKRIGGSGQYYFYLHGQGQAGFSVHYPNDKDSLIMGAPGVYNWAGTTIEVNNTVGRQQVYIADPIRFNENSAYKLFGYSVASGYFYGNNKLYYAASSPKSNKYLGKVMIFQFNENKPLKERQTIIGSQFGEYFGGSIAAGDINNDGCDDLIIGAPYHVSNTYNAGGVYIFLGSRKGQLMQQVQLNGQFTKGEFGKAVMFLGDINGDSYGDVAVGAPYEEEFSGVVYIYKGNTYGVDQQYCQRIVGTNISPEIRGFGISISRSADIDDNGYKDIAVGAHLSANAVILRSSPTIVIEYNMTAIPKELKRDSNKFMILACYWYTRFNESSIDINRTVVVDELLDRAAISKKQRQVRVITLYRERNTCENITIALKSINNYDAPITVFLSYGLTSQPQRKEVIYISDKSNKGGDIFCVRCPVLDESRSSRPSTINIPFTLDCGSDNICQAELSVEVNIPSLGNANIFVVGSIEYVNLQAIVKNTGENAYSTQIEILLPNIIFFRQIPPSCQEHNISLIVCDIGNPLRPNDEKTMNVDLDMNAVNKNNYERELYIFVRTLTTSNNTNTGWTSLKLNLERLADITIYGKSGEQSLPFGNDTHGMPNFTQIYQVEKMGQSPLEKVLVNITIPYAIRTAKTQVDFIKLYHPEGIFAGQPLMCKSDFNYIADSKSSDNSEMQTDNTERRKRHVHVSNERTETFRNEYEIVPNRTFFINCSMKEVVCSSVTCYVGPFEKRQTLASIEFKMMFDTHAISSLLGRKDMILFSTNGSVTIRSPLGFKQSGSRPDFVDVSSLFINEIKKKKLPPIWITVLSVIAGLLLLFLMAFGLAKVGFFKRTKKEELKNLMAAQETMAEDGRLSAESSPSAKHSTEDLTGEPENE